MITGLKVSSVSANRPTDDMITNMRFNINFDDVKVTDDNVEVMYTFTAIYEGQDSKQVGDLKIVGKLLAKETKAKAKEIADTWQNKKTLPVDFAEDVMTVLNFDFGSRGTLVAWSAGLVAPLPFSRAKIQQQPASQSQGA